MLPIIKSSKGRWAHSVNTFVNAVVVVVSPPHQSQRCGVSRFRSAHLNNDSTVSVVSFDISGTLKQKVGAAVPALATPPAKCDLTSREKLLTKPLILYCGNGTEIISGFR